MTGQLRIFSGNSNPALAREIAGYHGIDLGDARIGRFSDGEIHVEIDESVRGHDVFVVQSLCAPVHDSIFELLVMLDALSRGSTASLTAVLPYYAYARQDRQSVPRSPISAKLLADLIVTAGATRVLSMDLHAGQIQGFFSVPVDHLYGSKVLIDALRTRERFFEDAVLVSPDAGGVERVRFYSKALDAPIAIIDKRRSGPNVAMAMHVIGEVEGRDAYIVDDMIDTAGTLTQAAAALREHGARRVFAVATHAVLSGPAVDRINASVLEKCWITNTIPLTEKAAQCRKLEVVSVAPLIGEAINRVYGSTSVSSLFR